MKIAITGASGFIGCNLCRFLKAKGHEVIAIVRSEKTAWRLDGIELEKKVSDLHNKQALQDAFTGADAVIHLAALFNHPEASWKDYRSVNVAGTHNVMETSIRCGVPRVIHCSTIGVATGSGSMPYSEDTPYSPPGWDKYETTKCEGERAALSYHQKKGLAVVVVRPAQVYGPGDTSKAKFYRMVKNRIIINPGNTLKHLIFIDDLCRAFELAVTHERASGEIFIIGNRHAIPLRELIELVARRLNVKPPIITIPSAPLIWLFTLVESIAGVMRIKPPLFRRSMDFFTKSVEFNVDKARRLLGFESQVDLVEGIAQTANWYKANRLI